MARTRTDVSGERNRLLRSLSPALYERVTRRSEIVQLKIKKRLYRAGTPADAAYFPCSACLSMVTRMEDGMVVEVGTIGSEGMAGLNLFHGIARAPTDCICQVSGEARRIPRAEFVSSVADPEFSMVMRRYAHAWIGQLSRSVACNVRHTIDQRAARWLLMTQDRVQSDVLPLTQQFLAVMLAARRASVTVAANHLREQGIVRYTRGQITIVDRDKLLGAACECYERGRRDEQQAVPS